jgi:MFS family permease
VKRPYHGWILVWALGVTTIVSYGTTQYLFGVLVVPIQHELHWSRADLSGAFSIAFLVSGALGVPIGRLVDRHGARVLMTAGSLLGAASLALLSQVTQRWQFYLLWAGGLGLAMALTFYPVTFTVITNWFSRRRGSAMAQLTLLGGFASVIFYPLAGALIAADGWRATLLIMAGCQLLITAPIHAIVLRRHPEDLGLLPDGDTADAIAGERPSRTGHGIRQALGRPAFWTLTCSSGLSLLAQASILAHQVPYLIGRGFDPVFAAGIAGLLGVASLPSRLVLNLLSDRFGPRALLVLSTALLATGVGLLLLASPARWYALWLFVAVYGFAFGAVSPLRASVMAEQFGRRAYGSITALQGLPVSVLAAAGPVVAGALYDRLGDYRTAFGLAAAAFVAAMVALILTPRAEPASRPAPAPAGV